MTIRNSALIGKISDYIVVPGIALLIAFYCTMIYLSRNSLGIPKTVLLLLLAALAMFLWLKPLWKKHQTEDRKPGSAPTWQRVICAILAVGGAIGIIIQIRVGVQLELANTYLLFKLAMGIIGISFFTYIAVSGSFPGQEKPNRSDT